MNFEYKIGGTPLYRAAENLFLKLEYANATGSVKDRAALAMILDGEKRGILKRGGTVIEPTSGNMGISLAALTAWRGYGCIIVMPDTMSIERRQIMQSYGATVVLTAGGMAAAAEKARELAKNTENSFLPDQFSNPANPYAHYCTTGPEILAQTGGKVDILVAGVGTGGTITGTGRFLKEKNADLWVVAVEPKNSPLLSEGKTGAHRIEGIGANFLPKVLDVSVLDEIRTISNEDAFEKTRNLWDCGLFAGISAGAAYQAAEKMAAEHPEKNVVAILPDSGNRYFSVL